MKLYRLLASQSNEFFGSPEHPIQRDVTLIAQTPNCAEFLLLSKDLQPSLKSESTVPVGFDFTYCQAWGLTINDEVVARVVRDLRIKAYPSIGDQLDMLFHANALPADLTAQLQAVKDRYPKGI